MYCLLVECCSPFSWACQEDVFTTDCVLSLYWRPPLRPLSLAFSFPLCMLCVQCTHTSQQLDRPVHDYLQALLYKAPSLPGLRVIQEAQFSFEHTMCDWTFGNFALFFSVYVSFRKQNFRLSTLCVNERLGICYLLLRKQIHPFSIYSFLSGRPCSLSYILYQLFISWLCFMSVTQIFSFLAFFPTVLKC